MSKGRSRLSRLGVLAPAALSACMDASVLAVPAAGAIVSTVLKELSKAFMLKKWFHGVMSAKEAEHLIMEKGKNGSFLVRESQAHPGEYVLSVRVRGRVSHVMIRKLQNKYDVGSGEQFDDLVGLIEHFRSYPMIEASGDVLRLLQPVSGTKIRAHSIDKKVQELQEMEDHKSENKLSFDGEFQTLKMLEHRQVFTADVGLKPENYTKNRYRNVIPYDQTRVVLQKRDSRQDNDYINASYVRPRSLCESSSSVQSSNESLNSVQSLKIYSEPKKHVPLVTKSLSDDAIREVTNCMRLDKINGNLGINTVKEKTYIAAQGCMSNTKDDFWRMIWQEDVRVIAMITNEVEKGKVKCERYWPLPGQEETYDNLRVKAVSERLYEEYLTRELDVTDDKGCCRTVYQYQFTAWPDHGTPDASEGVLSFIEEVNRKMNQVSQSKNAPEHNILCVHCSAGVGRTGTFIVLDMLIDKVKSSGFNCEIDVYTTVKMVRAQRGGMVQNKSQYRFIYLALQDYIDHSSNFRTKRIYTSRA